MTGGFFRCTRYEVVEKVDEQLQSEMTDASEKHKALQELNRFVHYFSRYENHKRSLEVSLKYLCLHNDDLFAILLWYGQCFIFIINESLDDYKNPFFEHQ